jgi:hypothetical protein
LRICPFCVALNRGHRAFFGKTDIAVGEQAGSSAGHQGINIRPHQQETAHCRQAAVWFLRSVLLTFNRSEPSLVGTFF